MDYFLKVAAVLCLAGGLLSCEEELRQQAPSDPDELKEYNQRKITIEQGVSGTVLFEEGNCMPALSDSCKIYPVNRTIRIYEVSTADDTEGEGPFYSEVHTPLLATVESDADGFYQAALEPGEYSIFVEEGGRLYANFTNGDGEIQVAVIDSGWVTMIHPKLNYNASY